MYPGTDSCHRKYGRFELSAAVIFALLAIVLGVFLFNLAVTSRALASRPRKTPVPSAAAVARLTENSYRRARTDLKAAIEQRTKLLSNSVIIHFVSVEGELGTLQLLLKDNPGWVVFEVDDSGKGQAKVSAERIRQQLIAHPAANIPEPQSCDLLTTWIDAENVTRAQTECISKDGYEYDFEKLVALAKAALEAGTSELIFELKKVPARIVDKEGSSEFSLLATGRSNFKGSGAGRKANVRKGLNEKLNNVYIPAGAVFSFNSILGKSVSIRTGWQMALTIFEGGDLRPAPGGGICQVSTTLYRGILAAGFPILAQKNHSLYVSYYEKYGVGQDATIFPGTQDLVFQNDSGGPLLIQAYNEGDEAFVNIYGQDDGRHVTISGPYFSKSAPKDLLSDDRKVRANEIAWVRESAKAGAEPKREVFLARYKAIPKSLPDRWKAKVVHVRGSDQVASVEKLSHR
ncbi:hypothetical protein A3J34_02130 [Candidatus Peribacteria bacterium RIFCSPLOWO2_02_FULL_51_10]|nr:MAG: hypothetical protein A3C52_02360 [Candidatus Peribacteria bacterium RIFCSPHIGHO2_02_FULL_51_15]OGJ68090.1 MAG: hypothetical protein A3J34_02130 [Candidatus Peribacteria bacterium RIFCSPLOWO2_02_FULL_51_10]